MIGTLLSGPNITVNPDDIAVTSPETVTLNCTAIHDEDAPNQLSFHWMRNGNLLENATTSTMEMDNSTAVTNQLTVAYNVSATVVDTYQCIATNRELEDGAQSQTASVTVCKLIVGN